jgi:hypothetical protein
MIKFEDDPAMMITLDEVWPLWPSKVGQIKNLCIMSRILTRYTSDKNLRMIQSFVQES